MTRTQEEISERFKTVDDMMDIQKTDLLCYMEFKYAQPHLRDDYVKKVIAGEEKWEVSTDPKKELIDYIPFAFEKAYSQRGLSAGRSMLHMLTWIWLDDPEFYKEISDDLKNYTDYGLPQLSRICERYGIEEPTE